jgi:lipid-binding SYLF domain-containing protein
MKKSTGLLLLLLFAISLSGCQSMGGTQSRGHDSAAKIDGAASQALASLYAGSPEARALSTRAKGILVFPEVYKAGFIGGASYGDGALRVRGRTVGYYNTVSASYGLQAGVQKFGYALFFMDKSALSYLDRSEGWEVGVGPSIVVVDSGVARSLTTTTAREGIYAFIFDQKGLMAGLGLQGSKITRIQP